jgi:hypothetical protein
MRATAVVGSREFSNPQLVRDYIVSLPLDVVVVSGGAIGVDQIAVGCARTRGLQTLVFPALWHVYGKRAGKKRNPDIIAAADVVHAFWDGASPGTRHSIEVARKMNKPLVIHWPDGATATYPARG